MRELPHFIEAKSVRAGQKKLFTLFYKSEKGLPRTRTPHDYSLFLRAHKTLSDRSNEFRDNKRGHSFSY